MRCKPGDLAFIVQGDGKMPDENLGRIVKVLGPSPWPTCDWIVRSEGGGLYGALIHKVGDSVTVTVYDYRPQAHVADVNLRPIRGEPEEERHRDVRELSPRELDIVTVTGNR